MARTLFDLPKAARDRLQIQIYSDADDGSGWLYRVIDLYVSPLEDQAEVCTSLVRYWTVSDAEAAALAAAESAWRDVLSTSEE